MSEPRLTTFRNYLLETLVQRQIKSPNYSLRRFAAQTGVSPAALSQVLSGKRALTHKSALKIAYRLALSPAQISVLLDDQTSKPSLPKQLPIDEDQFRVIADWYHVAILALARTMGAKSSAAWVADRLNISIAEALSALERLERMGLISRKRERLIRLTEPIQAGGTGPSPAIRHYHKKLLALAEQAIESLPTDQRHITSVTLPIRPSKYAEAVRLIEEFRARLSPLVGTLGASEVYTMAIQFFPVTKIKGSKTRSKET